MIRQKSAKEINEQKWRRMRTILQKLKEKPLKSNDIGHILFGKSLNRNALRTVQNYLSELKALELISFDPTTGLYSSNENRIIFQSKHDYNVALKHSQRLVLSTRDNQRLDGMDPASIVRLLVFWKDNVYRHDPEDFRFLQHLKTGYFEIFRLMEEYRQKVTQLKLDNNYDVPHLGERPNRQTTSKKERAQLESMKAELIGKIYSLVDRVRHGSPLEGKCDACPGRYLSIKTG